MRSGEREPRSGSEDRGARKPEDRVSAPPPFCHSVAANGYDNQVQEKREHGELLPYSLTPDPYPLVEVVSDQMSEVQR